MTGPIGYPELMPGFRWRDVEANGTRIRCAVGGKGPPLLLLHGHPQTHLTWHKIAPTLAERFTVVAADLRGYGDSAKPESGEGASATPSGRWRPIRSHVMRALGHDSSRWSAMIAAAASRTAWRSIIPAAVEQIALIDIAPTATMYARTDKEFATRYFWWFFLIQPFDLPERLIAADPEFFLRKHIEGAEARRRARPVRACSRNICAATAIPRRATRSARITARPPGSTSNMTPPTRRRASRSPCWRCGARRARSGHSTTCWRPGAKRRCDVRGHAIDCGHCVQEEAPDALLAALKGLPVTGERSSKGAD